MFTILIIFVLWELPLFAETGEDPCKKNGVVVKNLAIVTLWYKKNNGDCTILKRNYMFEIKPGDTVEVFSDLVCETPYCGSPVNYSDYKSVDTDGNCRVRIFMGCTLSDM